MHGDGRHFAVAVLARGRRTVEEDLVLVARVEGGPMPLRDQIVRVDHVGEHTTSLHDALEVTVVMMAMIGV